MDCNITKNFLKELSRMCNMGGCSSCPIYNQSSGLRCIEMIINYSDKIVPIVQKWSDENPVEIDWTKVPFGTRVIVSDSDDYEVESVFVAYISQLKSPFLTLCSDGESTLSWHYCRLAPEVDPTPYYED